MFNLVQIIVYLGALTVFTWCFNTICFFYRTLYGTKASTARYGKDAWAVITGGTNGIGLAAARELATRGFNIVLIARKPKKLELIKEMVKQYGRQCKSVQVDFSRTTTAE